MLIFFAGGLVRLLTVAYVGTLPLVVSPPLWRLTGRPAPRLRPVCGAARTRG
ncbi:hypothetical protein ACFYTQ_16475 [Nocardia sp. NPDC004068]|uniref:hypothetical protein n=1 Tax=Nocardia sp. NPDC004068 TaxID=3364303 RepID=UPI0036CB2011